MINLCWVFSEFMGGYNRNIRFRSEILGFSDTGTVFVLWDCYWLDIDLNERKPLKKFVVEKYITDSFETEELAKKNEVEIREYYSEVMVHSHVDYGKDSKGITGFMVHYHIIK